MNILFIYPGISCIGFDSFGKLDNYDCRHLPLGMLYMAAIAREAGHEPSVLDLRKCRDFGHVAEIIETSPASVCAFSFVTPSLNYAIETAKICKKFNKITIAGGSGPSTNANFLNKTGLFDCIITGEGEITLKVILEMIERKESLPQIIKGEMVADLNTVPFPARDLYDVESHKALRPVMNLPEPILGFACSRGCPGKCKFCQPYTNNTFGKKVKFRSFENIKNEIELELNKHDYATIAFFDETFSMNKKLLKQVATFLYSEHPKIIWSLNSRVDTFTEDTARILSENGCKYVSFGFESGSQRMLDLMGKEVKAEQNIAASLLCHKYKLPIHANLLSGIPGETRDDFKKSYNMIKVIRPNWLYYNVLSPYPGSDFHDEFLEENTFEHFQSYEEFDAARFVPRLKNVNYVRVLYWIKRTNEFLFAKPGKRRSIKLWIFTWIGELFPTGKRGFSLFNRVKSYRQWEWLRKALS